MKYAKYTEVHIFCRFNAKLHDLHISHLYVMAESRRRWFAIIKFPMSGRESESQKKLSKRWPLHWLQSLTFEILFA